jgi:hypothetical protein
MNEQNAAIERIGPVVVDRTTSMVECRLSEMPDVAWRRAVRAYEARSPFFLSLSLTIATLQAKSADPTQSLDVITAAIDERIRYANVTHRG